MMINFPQIARLNLILLIITVALWPIPKADEDVNVNITFTASSNIAEGDNATYTCTSNHFSVVVHWYLNTSTVSTDPSVTSLGVITIGAASQISSLTIPGKVYPFNNTEVLCYTSGILTGNISPPSVILRIQGKLKAVNSLTAVQSNDSCCYYFNWSPPFTLPGVPILGYNINISYVTTNNGTLTVLQTNVNVTQWEYCPLKFSQHFVAVAAVNSVGEGEINTVNTTVVLLGQNYKLTSVHLNRLFLIPQLWQLNIKISNPFDCTNKVMLNSSTLSFVDTKTIKSSSVYLSFNTTSVDNTVMTFSAIIYTSAELLSVIYQNFTLRFFDVNDSLVISSDSTNTSIWCGYVHESLALGCHVQLVSQINTYSTNISRLKGMELISGTEPGVYTVYVYDIDYDGIIPSIPAIIIDNITIAAAASIEPMEVISATLKYATSSCQYNITIAAAASIEPMEVTSATLKYATSSCQCTQFIKASDTATITDCNSSLQIVTIGGSIIGFFIIVLVVTVLVHLVIAICWKRKSQDLSTEEGTVQPAITNPQYDNVEMMNIAANTNEISTNSCSAYGVVIQRY